MIYKKKTHARVTTLFLSLLGGLFLYLCLAITLRGIVSGHIPMTNGHETMQLMAACTALLTFIFYRRIPVTISFGFLLCGLALLVSMLGESNPQITQLAPVLQSPLLSIHVVVIMIAYSLLAFVMLNGITAVILLKLRTTNRTPANNQPDHSLPGSVLIGHRNFHWRGMGECIMGALLGLGS